MNNTAANSKNGRGSQASELMSMDEQINLVNQNQADTTLEVYSAKDVPALNVQQAFLALTPDNQKEVQALADSIDVTKIENVMSYGKTVLNSTFEQCGIFLKKERGSEADQEVIKQVIEMTQRVSDSNEDFKIVLQEPGFFEKVLLKISGANRKNRTQKIQTHVATNYKLVGELRSSCESWLETLRGAMGDITASIDSDSKNLDLLEKYIIAGNMAKVRIESKLDQLQEESKTTGLIVKAQQYDNLKAAYEIFCLRLKNLEKSRVTYYLSIGQLYLIKKSNSAVQVSVHTQAENCTALIAQQLRNALLNAKNQEVIEGQKALSRLSDELIKDVSVSIGATAQEAEKLLYYGSYNVDAAKEAVKTVIDSCKDIKRVAEENLPKMNADVEELNGLVEELRPYIYESSKIVPQINSTAPESTGTGKNELKF